MANWFSVIPEANINASTEKLVKNLKDLNLDADEVLISFDVVSLYTNVPMEEALTYAADLLYSGKYIDNEPPIEKEVFIELGKLCLENVLMLTSDGYYIQKEGLAMGSPVSPLLANIWMSKFDDLFGQYNSKLYMRYVDDIITTIKRINIPRRLAAINKWHKNLKFTCEEEDDQGWVSFLDMTLHHTRDKIESSW